MRPEPSKVTSLTLWELPSSFHLHPRETTSLWGSRFPGTPAGGKLTRAPIPGLKGYVFPIREHTQTSRMCKTAALPRHAIIALWCTELILEPLKSILITSRWKQEEKTHESGWGQTPLRVRADGFAIKPLRSARLQWAFLWRGKLVFSLGLVREGGP